MLLDVLRAKSAEDRVRFIYGIPGVHCFLIRYQNSNSFDSSSLGGISWIGISFGLGLGIGNDFELGFAMDAWH
jgi:hypothetical protein